MLSIQFGIISDQNYIFNPDVFFRNTYEDEWLIDEISKNVIHDIDNSEVAGLRLIVSPSLGPIPPEWLSIGAKTLILISHDEKHIFNASVCEDNCAKWLLKISEEKDITIRLGTNMDFGTSPFKIKIRNTGKIVSSMIEMDNEIIEKGLL